MEYIECDDIDIDIACNIMENAVMSSSLLEIPKSAVELHNMMLKLAEESSAKNGLKVREVRLTQRYIREKTGREHCWIKRNLRILVDFEYVEIIRGGGERSKGYYRLKDDKPVEEKDTAIFKPRNGHKKDDPDDSITG